MAIFETSLTDFESCYLASVTRVSVVQDTKTLQMLSRFCHLRIELVTLLIESWIIFKVPVTVIQHLESQTTLLVCFCTGV